MQVQGRSEMKQWHFMRNRKTMGQMLREALKGQYRMSVLTIAILVIGLVYVISPIDIIPDKYFFVGWIDDAVVIFLVIKRLQFETKRFIRFKAAERRRGNV